MKTVEINALYVKYRTFLIIFWVAFAILNSGQQYLINHVLYNNPMPWQEYLPSLFRFTMWMFFSIFVLRRILISKKDVPNFDATFYLVQTGLGLLFVAISLVLEVLFYYSYNRLFESEEYVNLLDLSMSVGSANLIRLNYSILIYIMITVFAYFVRTNFDSRVRELEESRLSAELNELKLQFLNSQIKPHFIFNTQHAIISLMEEGNVKKSSAMLVKLSVLLRNVLNNSNKNSITLAEEIENLKNYIDIQKVRFGEKVDVHYKVNTSIHNIQIPPLLLQPIVENIFHHAFAEREEGCIKIEVDECSQYYQITIEDDGTGFDLTALNGSRIGLSNVKKRIENFYGDEASFDLSSIVNQGTRIKIVIGKSSYIQRGVA